MNNIGHNQTFTTQGMSGQDKQTLKDAISEINDSMTQIAAQRDLIKSILETASEELGLDKKLIRKMAKTYYNASFDMDKEEFETFEEFYTDLFPKE